MESERGEAERRGRMDGAAEVRRPSPSKRLFLMIAAVWCVLVATVQARADYYNCFTNGNCAAPALSNATDCLEGAGADYGVTVSNVGAAVTVLSIHGGGIEANTTAISAALANLYGWNRYDFNAHGSSRCLGTGTNTEKLHISAIRFDDSRLVALVSAHPKAVAIHGYASSRGYARGVLCVGGLDAVARNAFISYVNGHSSSWPSYALTPVDASSAGSGATCDGLSGTAGANVVNRTSAGRGLQLELSYGLRSDLVNTGDPTYDPLRNIIYGAINQAMTGTGSTPTGSADVVECGGFSIDGGSISEVTQGTDRGCTGFTPAFHFADETAAGGGAYYAWHNSATGTITFPVTSTTAPAAHLSVSFRVYGHTAAGSAAVYARSTAGQWIQVGTIGSEQAPDWDFTTVDIPLSPPSTFLPSSPNAYQLPVRLITTGAIGELDIDRAYLNVSSGTPATATYPVHRGVATTWFYVGEPAGPENDYIANLASAWDDGWRYHYTGSTDTSVSDYPSPVRSGPNYYPSGYTPRENPFYFALPYNDFDASGAARSNRALVVYWGGSGTWSSGESMCKNRWVKVSYGGRSAYAQWEDVGPANEDDAAYVFGTAAPRNAGSGLDISPAVRDYLGIDPNVGVVQADWQFVDSSEVAPGPWMNIVTTRQVCWGCPN